ncbi:MAG: restriction endonuclease subunit S [Polyangia bacterium]
MRPKADWPITQLGKLAEFRNGVNYTKNSFGEGIKVIGVSDFQDYIKPRYQELEQINPEGVVTDRNILRDGDILFVRSNGNRELIGRSLYIENPPARITHSAFTIRLRFTKDGIYPQFYAYLFRAPVMRKAMTAYGGGTNICNLNQDILASLEVLVPPSRIQKRIVNILSNYDDLIEDSQRRIQILESMARALYREWFVHFRFPGHEATPLGTSPAGNVPKGWEVGRLDDILVLQRGFDLPKNDRSEGTVPIYAATGVNGFHSEAKVKAPGVVTGRSGTIGTVLYVQDDFWPLNTTLWVKDFPKSEPLYAYYVLSELDLKQFNSGAAVPTLNRNDIHGLDALIPPRWLQQRFQEVGGAMLAEARILQLQIENLRRTRDLLLPRLLSGQIDLSQT